MAFLVYERMSKAGKDILRATGNHFTLGGHSLIYKAWEARGKPKNQGWHVNADELIKLYSGGQASYETMRLIIDYDPNSKTSIGLIELLHVYAYTYAKTDKVDWTPLMLRLRDVYICNPKETITKDKKAEMISEITPYYSDDYIEFLYLQGDKDKRGWAWGRNGSTNAAFIHGEARKYFKNYFCE